MKPECIEELARLAYEAAQDNELGAVPDYDELAEHEKAAWSRLARALYAAAMRDAAGVAETALVSRYTNGSDIGTARRCIATALETIAKDAHPRTATGVAMKQS